MRLKIYALALMLLTVMIPIRRLLWHQAATQVSPVLVWLTIAANVGVLVCLVKFQISKKV